VPYLGLTTAELAVNTILPLDQGGFDGEVFYIDTEDTFRPERITQMAEAVGIDPLDALDRIHVARAYNSAHQILLVDEIKRMSKNIDVKLIIVDSLTSHFRAEYIGRGMLAPRQQKLNRHLKELKQLADVQNALVLVTNQVMSKPDAMWGDPTRAIGGHIVAHASTFRLYLRKSKGGRRIARLVDSPNLPDGEAECASVCYDVTADGSRRVPPHRIGLRHDLVGHQNQSVLDVCELLELLQMAVELLLPGGQHATPDILCTEMTGQRVDDD
jgi:DNA repair protein RadA